MGDGTWRKRLKYSPTTMETDDGSSDWMGIDLLHEGEDGRAGQRGGDDDGDGDDERRKF